METDNPQMKQLIDFMKTMSNPQDFIKQSPAMQTILAMYNGDAKSAFYALCKQRNINPEEFLQQINNYIKK